MWRKLAKRWARALRSKYPIAKQCEKLARVGRFKRPSSFGRRNVPRRRGNWVNPSREIDSDCIRANPKPFKGCVLFSLFHAFFCFLCTIGRFSLWRWSIDLLLYLWRVVWATFGSSGWNLAFLAGPFTLGWVIQNTGKIPGFFLNTQRLQTWLKKHFFWISCFFNVTKKHFLCFLFEGLVENKSLHTAWSA